MTFRFPALMSAAAVAALMASGPQALALSPQELIDSLTAQGYTRIEMQIGRTQTKVEAIRGTEKVETIYDSATGAVLKREVEAVESDDNTTPGIKVRERNRDFLKRDRRDDRDDRADDDGDDDKGGKGRGRGRGGDDRADDDDDDRGRGSDD